MVFGHDLDALDSLMVETMKARELGIPIMVVSQLDLSILFRSKIVLLVREFSW